MYDHPCKDPIEQPAECISGYSIYFKAKPDESFYKFPGWYIEPSTTAGVNEGPIGPFATPMEAAQCINDWQKPNG